MKVLLTGGTGLLGKELISLNGDILAPSREIMDVNNYHSCFEYISKQKPNIIIHAAAFTSPPKCDKNPWLARRTNVVGTLNILEICEHFSIKMVYLSTDYVFDGNSGPYKISDAINPINIYAITKASGELLVKTYKNSLIIRTSFCEREFPYEKAFEDQYTSRDYVDIIAPKILNCSLSEKKGIVHIGTERKTVFDLARKRKPNVGKIKRSQVNFNVPRDTSFEDTYE